MSPGFGFRLIFWFWFPGNGRFGGIPAGLPPGLAVRLEGGGWCPYIRVGTSTQGASHFELVHLFRQRQGRDRVLLEGQIETVSWSDHASTVRQNWTPKDLITATTAPLGIVRVNVANRGKVDTTPQAAALPGYREDETQVRSHGFCPHKIPVVFESRRTALWGFHFTFKEDKCEVLDCERWELHLTDMDGTDWIVPHDAPMTKT